MGVDINQLHPELQARMTKFILACAAETTLKANELQLVITEAKRLDLLQARYFCMGRTPSEIAAHLDRAGADQRQRAIMGQAIADIFGDAAMPEDRAPGRIITNALPCTGPHCLGVAFHARLKRAAHILADDDMPWEILGALGKKCGLIWGGDWRMRDLEHYELPKNLWPTPHPDPLPQGARETRQPEAA